MRPSSRPRTPAYRGATRVWLARAALILAGATYLVLYVEAIAGFPLDPVRSYLSELAAADQSTSVATRSLDGVAACLIILGLLPLRHQRRAGLIAAAGLAVLAAATLAETFLPLDCAVSVPECAAREVSGHVSTAHDAHTVSSAVAGVGTVMSALGTWAVWRMRPHRHLRTSAIAVSAATVVMILLVAVGEIISTYPWGIAQRIQIAATSGVVALAGWTLSDGASRESGDIP